MKKTVLQMVLTCVVLGILLSGGDAAVQNGGTPARAAMQIFGSQAEKDEVRLPILMYHSILKDKARAGKFIVSPVTLAADLDYLQDRGYKTVTVSDLVRYVDGLADLPEKPVMITFDDGHFNNYQYAYPLLKERGMRAVISAIGIQTEQFSETGLENAYWSYLSAERLIEMQQSGVFEVQNHSYDMHENDARRGCLRMRGENLKSYRTLLLEDAEQAQTLFIENGLPAPIAYVYPFGMYSRETEDILKGLGFMCTITCEERVNTLRREQEDLYRLGRFNRPAGVSTASFLGAILEE